MIYKKIQTECEKNKISITQLETELGFGNGTISKWKISSPSINNLRKVAMFFGTTIDNLIE